MQDCVSLLHCLSFVVFIIDYSIDFVIGVFGLYAVCVLILAYYEKQKRLLHKQKMLENRSSASASDLEFIVISPIMPSPYLSVNGKSNSVLGNTSTSWVELIRRQHSWFAIFYTRKSDALNKVDRATLLLCMVW